MSTTTETPRLPKTFARLAWSNLAAQSAEQIALAAAPIVAVLLLGVGVWKCKSCAINWRLT